MLHRLLRIQGIVDCSTNEIAVLMALLMFCETTPAKIQTVESEIMIDPGQTDATVEDIRALTKLGIGAVRCALTRLEKRGIIDRMRIDGNTSITTVLPYGWVKAGADKPKPTTRIPKPKDFEPEANRLYELYVEKVNPQKKTRQRAVRNIMHYLTKFDGAQLEHSILAYANATNGDRFKKDPANFFGKQDPVFDSYFEDDIEGPNSASETMLDKKYTQACELYEEGGKRLLYPFCERYGIDPREMEGKIESRGL